MYTRDTCREEFETLTRPRLDHRPCPVADRQRRQEEARRRPQDECKLEVGDRWRVVGTGEEVEIVDIGPGDTDEDGTQVVWVPTGEADTP